MQPRRPLSDAFVTAELLRINGLVNSTRQRIFELECYSRQYIEARNELRELHFHRTLYRTRIPGEREEHFVCSVCGKTLDISTVLYLALRRRPHEQFVIEDQPPLPDLRIPVEPPPIPDNHE